MNQTSEAIKGLYPKILWGNFYELTLIPRPSKHEEKVRKFLVGFAINLNLEHFVDEVGNVIIRKPATPGMENRKGVILQAHVDMVPQKNTDKIHNFETDPIETIIENGWVHANGTTLGADNGIGVAAILAILESDDIAHGPIEALFTVNEETGLTGAEGLKAGLLDGEILLNLDSEDEGFFCIGCAGGINAQIEFEYFSDYPTKESASFKISVTGLKGGHSAVDINLGRGNAIKILNRILWTCSKEYELQLAEISGGDLRNAIPREAYAMVVVPKKHQNSFLEYLAKIQETIKAELSAVEPDIKIESSKIKTPENVFGEDWQSDLLKAIYACPNGVIRMSNQLPGLVETSINFAIIKTDKEKEKVSITCLLRSSIETSKQDLQNMVQSVFELADETEVTFSGGYPGWKPNPISEILNLMKDLYQGIFHKDATVTATHGGLECGLLGDKYPNWDMISFGPTIRDPHSPSEKVEISSVGKFWDFLVEVLKNIPAKK